MKNNQTHTPGPWGILGGTSYPLDYYPIRAANGGAHIAAVITERHANVPNKSGAANARLIAAAPELLAALDQCLTQAFKHEVQTWKDSDGTDAEKLARIVGICRAAIAKVRP